MPNISGFIHALLAFAGAHGRALLLAMAFFVGAHSCVPLLADDYPLGPDSERHAGVPQGAVTHYTWTSKIFPGTTRDYWVYVPAQYQTTKPACVMIFQDGEWFMQENNRMRIPIVFDNLISKGEMPVTIAIFINPGVLKALSPDQQDRFNRSFEYDSLGDRYARFLIAEILPEVAKQWNLSKNPDDRAIAGLSSGGICAFNAAWNRPDAFHRVLSFIGSFADLRGGDIYPALIRKTEPKPLRVFLQDGSNDLNLFAGDWWLANQTMASALKWAGYDVKFVTGDKDHDMIQGGAILPDALRWLWRDYPAPVAKPAPNGTGERSIPILDPKSEWEAVAPTLKVNSGIAADRKGDIYFADGQDHRIVSVDGNGTISDFRHVVDELAGMRFGPDGTLYACVPASKSIQTFSASKPQEHSFTIATACRDVAVHDKDEIFFTRTDGWVGYSRPRLTIEELAHIFGKPSGILMSPDNSTLFVSNETKRWIWTFQPQADGSLSGGEPFYRLEVSEDTSEIGGYGMSVDTEGYLYVATKLGIQVCDQPGRVVAIINPPADGPLLGVTFGGKDFDYLYVDQGDKLYRRHMLRKGVPPGTVLKPPTPRL